MSDNTPVFNPFATLSIAMPGGLVPPAPIVSIPQMSTIDAAPVPTAMDPSLVNRKDLRADLIWGRTKSGKGENAWFGAYWVAAVLGKKFLYLTSEPGSVPASIKAAAAAGLGDILNIAGHPNLIGVAQTVLEGGRWPVYRRLNDGTVIRDFQSREAVIDPKEHGMLICDSLTSLGDELLSWLSSPANQVKLPMTPGKDKFSVSDVDPSTGQRVEFGGSSGTHVYFAQQRLYELVVASANLPVDKKLWIAREARGSRGEKKARSADGKGYDVVVAGEPMYGPQIPGSGDVITRITGWFGGSYHTDIVDVSPQAAPDPMNPFAQMAPKKDPPKLEYRLYLKPYPDSRTGVLYDVGNRFGSAANADPAKVPAYLVCSEVVDGKKLIHTGLNTVYQKEADFSKGTTENLRETFAEMLAKFNKDGGSK